DLLELIVFGFSVRFLSLSALVGHAASAWGRGALASLSLSASSVGTSCSTPVAVALRRSRMAVVGSASRAIAPQPQRAHGKPPVSATFTVFPSPTSVL